MITIWVATLLNTLVAGLVLLWARRPRTKRERGRAPVDLRRALYASLTALCAFAVELPILIGAGANRFGIMNFAFLSLFVMLPVMGFFTLLAAVLFRRPNPGPYVSRSVCALGVISLLLAPIGAYATFVEPFDLRVEAAAIRVPAGRTGGEPLRIGVMSDIQTNRITDYERSAVAALLAQQPDIILLPGDFYQGTGEEFEAGLPAYRALLGSLHAPGGVYAVLGNIDHREVLDRLFEHTSVRLLLDESVQVRVRDRLVTICGVSSYACTTPNSVRAVRACEALRDDGDIRILLAHSPDAAFALPAGSRIDLVACGHTHGGQVRLPLIGPPVTFSQVPRSIAAGGLHLLNGHPVYVSRGIGHEGAGAPRVRFLCPPDISIISLTN